MHPRKPDAAPSSNGVDPDADLEASAKMDEFKLFYLIGKLYAEGAKSRNQASRILDKPSVKKLPDTGLASSPSEMSRAIHELTPFFRRRFRDPRLTLFQVDKTGGLRARFTVEGEKAWRWTDGFLRRKLGPSWWGFVRRLTPDEEGLGED